MRALIIVVASGLAACGTEGGVDGGGAHLPSRGIAGWVVGDALAIASPADATLTDPSALVVGDEVVLYLTKTSPDGDAIVRTTSRDGTTFGAPTLLLADAAAPSVAARASGFWLAFEDGAGIALAESDDGLSFTRVASSGLEGLSDPSLVVDGDRLIVFAVSAEGSIVRSEAGSDHTFSAPTVVLAPIAECTNAFGEPVPCWDGTALAGPDVRVATTPTGRTIWRMWFTGRTSVHTDLGFAASSDGITGWTRYAFNPVIKQSTSSLSPTSIVFGADYLLYWAVPTTDASGIANARITPSATLSHPTETW